MFKKPLLSLLFIFWVQHSSWSVIFLAEIVQNGLQFIDLLNDIRTSKDTTKEIISVLTNTNDHLEIVESLTKMNHKLDDLQGYTKDRLNHIALLLEELPSELAIQSKMMKLDSFIVVTNKLWNELMSYMKRNGTDDMFLDLANMILDKLKLPLQRFRHVLTPFSGTITTQRQGMFMLLVENAHNKRDIQCDQGETSHHTVVRFFYMAMSTDIKAHTLLFLANLLKYPMDHEWRERLETEFRKQLDRSLNGLTRSLKMAQPPYIRSCDPDIWRLDENYYGLYGYRQQTVYYLIGAPRSVNCMLLNKNTDDYPIDGRHYPVKPLNKHAECEGDPRDCHLFDLNLWDLIVACAAEKGPYRIRFVKHLSKIYGTDKKAIEILLKSDDDDNNYSCSPENVYKRRVGLESRQSACRCECPQSRMKIMTQMMFSKTADNYVIVGVRIHKIGDYIYIQIAEGKLEANGYISKYSWVNSSRAAHPTYGVHSEVANANRSFFFLGDKQLKPGQALTGIQFLALSTNGGSGFAVSINGMKFDYRTGKLDKKEFNFDFVERGHNKELKFPNKSPIHMKEYERSSPKSDGYTHIKLQPSDLSDDYGQTTLPLLDGVPILTNPLSPIGGVGLFYKGYIGDYAGFLSLRLYPINFVHFMDTLRDSYN